MPLFLTPPYLILLGAVALVLGAGEDAAGWTPASVAVLLVGLAALARGTPASALDTEAARGRPARAG